ncbi:Helix-turn-helix domain of transposase family ISL3 [Paraburkholderia hospita]|nr:Helix-turn-helix domain of transposase family ISL3 [Paraburkholderia hospita]
MTWCSRVSKDAFEWLEPCALKGARTVLRGLGAGNRVRLPDECYLEVRVPRVRLPDGSVRLVEPDWVGKLDGFTLLFEALVLALCREMTFAAVARVVNL